MFIWCLFLIIPVFCFFELIVYNEEVLLFFCFASFVIVVFEFLGDSISAIFQDRRDEIEKLLLNVLRINLNESFNNQGPRAVKLVSMHLIFESLIAHRLQNGIQLLLLPHLKANQVLRVTYLSNLREISSFLQTERVNFHTALQFSITQRISRFVAVNNLNKLTKPQLKKIVEGSNSKHK